MKYPVSALILTASTAFLLPAGDAGAPVYQSEVNMVTLTFKVENRGRAVRGLNAADLEVLEDGIPQRLTEFVVSRSSEAEKQARVPQTIYLLVDTSNAMYRGYAWAYDSMCQFIRGMDPRDAVAVYTFSRNISRATAPTLDRYRAMAGLQDAAAGDDTALYNALLLTLRDAEKVSGPKKVVVFSNGADNASMVSPDDVARVAEDAGIPVYVVSTQDNDEVSVNAWSRITRRTGGEAHYAPLWTMQAAAFRSISDAIRDAYTVSYYSSSTRPGFRKLTVRVKGKPYSIRCRPGYTAPSHAPLRTASVPAAGVMAAAAPSPAETESPELR